MLFKQVQGEVPGSPIFVMKMVTPVSGTSTKDKLELNSILPLPSISSPLFSPFPPTHPLFLPHLTRLCLRYVSSQPFFVCYSALSSFPD